MTTIYILLGIIILSLIRIFGIVKENAIKLQKITPQVHFMYEQFLKEKTKKENETHAQE